MQATLAMPAATELLPLIPELVLVGAAFALLMLDLFLDNSRRIITHTLALVVMAAVVWMLATGVGGQGSVFSGMFVRDTLADVSKVVIVAVSALSLVYGWPYLRERNLYPGEAPVLVMFATAGMMMMVSAGSLVMVYLAWSCWRCARTPWSR